MSRRPRLPGWRTDADTVRRLQDAAESGVSMRDLKTRFDRSETWVRAHVLNAPSSSSPMRLTFK